MATKQQLQVTNFAAIALTPFNSYVTEYWPPDHNTPNVSPVGVISDQKWLQNQLGKGLAHLGAESIHILSNALISM